MINKMTGKNKAIEFTPNNNSNNALVCVCAEAYITH